MTVTAERRDWIWDADGELEGLYVETREVVVKNGPNAGKEKLVFDFHVGLDDEPVSVWETDRAADEVPRGAEAAAQARLRAGGAHQRSPPMGKREGANGVYRDFNVDFEHAAPKRSAAELLAAEDDEDDDDPIPSSRRPQLAGGRISEGGRRRYAAEGGAAAPRTER